MFLALNLENFLRAKTSKQTRFPIRPIPTGTVAV